MSETPVADAEDLACMLVGRYFSYFATLERSLHRAISYLFDLKLLETEMLLANITVRDKANIVMTAVEFYSRTRPDDWAKGAVKTLERILTTTAERNFLAHTQFSAAKDGVEFFKVKAKGKFEIPDIVWKTGDFKVKYENLITLAMEVGEIITEMRSHKIRLKISEDLSKPNLSLASLGFLGGPYNPDLTPPNSPPLGSILGTKPQTHPEPQPKAEGEENQPG